MTTNLVARSTSLWASAVWTAVVMMVGLIAPPPASAQPTRIQDGATIATVPARVVCREVDGQRRFTVVTEEITVSPGPDGRPGKAPPARVPVFTFLPAGTSVTLNEVAPGLDGRVRNIERGLTVPANGQAGVIMRDGKLQITLVEGGALIQGIHVWNKGDLAEWIEVITPTGVEWREGEYRVTTSSWDIGKTVSGGIVSGTADAAVSYKPSPQGPVNVLRAQEWRLQMHPCPELEARLQMQQGELQNFNAMLRRIEAKFQSWIVTDVGFADIEVCVANLGAGTVTAQTNPRLFGILYSQLRDLLSDLASIDGENEDETI